jgi:hypothetical protein
VIINVTGEKKWLKKEKKLKKLLRREKLLEESQLRKQKNEEEESFLSFQEKRSSNFLKGVFFIWVLQLLFLFYQELYLIFF